MDSGFGDNLILLYSQTWFRRQHSPPLFSNYGWYLGKGRKLDFHFMKGNCHSYFSVYWKCPVENLMVDVGGSFLGIEMDMVTVAQNRGIPHTSEDLKARWHSYSSSMAAMSCCKELFRKGREARDQIPNICWIMHTLGMRAGVAGSEHHKCHLQIGRALRFSMA